MSNDVSKGLSDLESKLQELEGEFAAADERPRADSRDAGTPDLSDSRSARTSDLEQARASVDRIAAELCSGFDELIGLRSRLDQSRKSLIEDYERLLAGHGPPADPPLTGHGPPADPPRN